MRTFPSATLPDSPEHDQLRELLFLRAVIPAFGTLLLHDGNARSILGQKTFSAGFGRSASPHHTCLQFSRGTACLLNAAPGQPELQLDFGDTAATARFLLDRSRRIRLRRGFFRPLLLLCLARLALRLKFLLLPPVDRPLRPSDLQTHLLLTLTVAASGLSLLSIHDPVTKTILAGAPDGSLCFEVAGTPVRHALEKADGKITSLQNIPHKPAAVITFADSLAATEILRHRGDSHAALCLGRLSLRGLVPLADGIGAAMDRLNLLMTP